MISVPDHDDDRNAGSGNSHAWLQVYLPGPGRVDFDPASGIVGNFGLVRVAVVRDPCQVIPREQCRKFSLGRFIRNEALANCAHLLGSRRTRRIWRRP
jgi:hypothetical protein